MAAPSNVSLGKYLLIIPLKTNTFAIAYTQADRLLVQAYCIYSPSLYHCLGSTWVVLEEGQGSRKPLQLSLLENDLPVLLRLLL